MRDKNYFPRMTKKGQNDGIRVEGDIAYLPVLGYGLLMEAWFSPEDILRVKEFPKTWYAKRYSNTFYVVSWFYGKTILLHRYLVNAPNGLQIDHLDRDGMNDRGYMGCVRAWVGVVLGSDVISKSV